MLADFLVWALVASRVGCFLRGTDPKHPNLAAENPGEIQRAVVPWKKRDVRFEEKHFFLGIVQLRAL